MPIKKKATASKMGAVVFEFYCVMVIVPLTVLRFSLELGIGHEAGSSKL